MTLYEAIRNQDGVAADKCLKSGESLFEKNAVTGITPLELCCLIGGSGVKNVVFHHLHPVVEVVVKKGKKRG